ncbi:site-specific integrase [Lentzea flava]|uniref:Integrase n=1 Tax=Lentzea flava TaxID=103732 RepID=A0ABQ2V0U1_9PSEU|nr:site-specific integrase [Lentzea flava]MCP2202708.1 Site-specific recombinase XerD [Lentzea flava]GGU61770.1 integrase [Lentzea flava]
MSDPIKEIELKDGTIRYRFVVDVGNDPRTGKRKQLTQTFDKRKEAVAEYERIRHQCRTGEYVMPSKMTVAQLVDAWLEQATVDVEESTKRGYTDCMRLVREHLGHKPLQRLDEADIDDLVRHMLTEGRKVGGQRGTGLGVRSVEMTLGRLRAALNLAIRWRLVSRNVAAFTKIPRDARKQAAAKRATRKPWDAEEVRTFLLGIARERLYAPMLLSLMGLRPAEVCGLRWSDVDLTAATIRVGENTRTMVAGVVVEKTAKSESGKRTLPLPAPVLAALKSFKAAQAAEKLELGESYTDSGYVLVDEAGLPVKTNALRWRAYRLMAKVGVRGKGEVRLYDCRHSTLTYLAANGVPDVVLAKWAGHADGGSLAKRVYIHPDASHLRGAADKLSALLG